ncbi:DNA damage-binding protein 1a [Rhizophlyctis rosea]|nr:DNA damage-binding protein 1a [Rhizophlyctis rosea]
MVVGEQSLCVVREGGGSVSVGVRPTIFKCWEQLDPEGTRYLLGDYQGGLHIVVMFLDDGGDVKEVRVQKLGVTSIPTTLTYLDASYLYIGSHFGDSQLVSLSSSPVPSLSSSSPQSYISLVESYTSLSPVLDFCVVEAEGGGQAQVVAACGGFRVGVHDTLVMSFVGETRFAKVDPEEGSLSPLDDDTGFVTDETTLACGNVEGGAVIQVTPTGVRLVALEGYMVLSTWEPEGGKRITQGSVNWGQVVVSLGGGEVVYFEVLGGEVKEVGRKKMPHEVSCLDISITEDGAKRSNVFVCGLWEDVTVRVVRIVEGGKLEEGEVVELGGEIIPRSVIMAKIEDVTYVMAGLGDGTLYTFILNTTTGTLTDKKKVALGTQPITLSSFRSEGRNCVFASSDRPTVVYGGGGGRVLWGGVNLKDVTHMTPFNFSPASTTPTLAFATEGVIKIGTVEATIQRLHVRKVEMGETVRRSWVRVLDEGSFEVLNSHRFPATETVQSIVCLSIPAAPSDSTSSSNIPTIEVFVVGTAYVRPTEDDPTEGRIVVFAVGEGRKLRVLSDVRVKGSVYCLEEVEGRVVAGVNGRVEVFEWTYGVDNATPTLTPVSTHVGNIINVSLASRGEFVLTGDLMKSVSLLRLHTSPPPPTAPTSSSTSTPSSSATALELVARDTDPVSVMDVEFVDDDCFLVGDEAGNLMCLRKRGDSGVEEERRRLEQAGWWGVGGQVNRLRKGTLNLNLHDATVKQRATPVMLFGTVDGMIGTISVVESETFALLTRVQEGMRRVVRGFGGLVHEERYVTQNREVDDAGFVDGDLVERFVELDAGDRERVLEGIEGVGVEDVLALVEELERLH